MAGADRHRPLRGLEPFHPPPRRRAAHRCPTAGHHHPARSQHDVQTHEFHLTPLPDGGTRFLQTETFTGVLVPLLRQALDDTALGFAHMNQALANRAVTVPPLIRSTDP